MMINRLGPAPAITYDRQLAYSAMGSYQEHGGMSAAMHLRSRPDWRYSLARDVMPQIADINEFVADYEYDDLLVNELLPFLFDRPMLSRPALARIYPELYWAVYLYEDRVREHKRKVLEGMVLADMPVEVISDYFQTTIDSVWMYERVFFDVRDRLDNTVFMYEDVFRPSLTAPGTPHFYDSFWKMLCWKNILGAKAVRAMVELAGTQDGDVAGRLNIIRAQRALMDTVVAGQARMPNAFNAVEIIAEYQRYLEADTESDATQQYQKLMSVVAAAFNVTQGGEQLKAVEADVREDDQLGYEQAVMTPLTGLGD